MINSFGLGPSSLDSIPSSFSPRMIFVLLKQSFVFDHFFFSISLRVRLPQPPLISCNTLVLMSFCTHPHIEANGGFCFASCSQIWRRFQIGDLLCLWIFNGNLFSGCLRTHRISLFLYSANSSHLQNLTSLAKILWSPIV